MPNQPGAAGRGSGGIILITILPLCWVSPFAGYHLIGVLVKLLPMPGAEIGVEPFLCPVYSYGVVN